MKTRGNEEPHRKYGCLQLVNKLTGQLEELHIEAFGWSRGSRGGKPSHGDNITGYCQMPIKGKYFAVWCESLLESYFLNWLSDCSSLIRVGAQPVTAYGTFSGIYHQYTCDFVVEMDPVPADLRRMGFSYTTLIEVKPSVFADNWIVQCKAELMRMATGLPVLVLGEEQMSLSILNEQEDPYVH
jgi:hypothetical protein